ncbi:MAG: GNAT family N-acetyltransferase [Opitutales bacterium]
MTPPTPLRIEKIPPESLTPEQEAAVTELSTSVWPVPGPRRVELQKDSAPGDDRRHLRLLGWHADQLVATCFIFERTIRAGDVPLPITALAGVCTHASQRGQGFGRAIVKAAFHDVDTGRYPVCLFQTGVPGFYEKLGARRIDSRFVNSRNPAMPDTNPFWDDIRMIYPGPGPWPDCVFDLCGPAY